MWTLLEIVPTAAILGISLAIFITTLVLAILFCLGIYPRPRNDQHSNHSLQSLDLHVLPRQPPAVHHRAPVPSCRTSTLASTGGTKRTFLGRWKSVFTKEAMEILPEQDSPLSSYLQSHPTTQVLEIPPIQYDPFLPQLPRTWQGTSSDSAWGKEAYEVPPSPSNLPAVVLGLPQQLHQPRLSLAFSGTIPISPTRLSSLSMVIPIEQESQQQSSIRNLPLSQPSLSPNLNHYVAAGYWDRPVSITEQPPTPP
ncbi:hypothetical protein EDD85DRAFT_955063 [Armillaria nabsnona]|nr:hypothetical protein EDD85DRAFT_955063 [Armillaria nabsnona]